MDAREESALDRSDRQASLGFRVMVGPLSRNEVSELVCSGPLLHGYRDMTGREQEL